MTAWGVVAVCGIGGGAAGPFLDSLARRVRRPAAPPVELSGPAEAPVRAEPLAAAALVDGAPPPPTGVPASASGQGTRAGGLPSPASDVLAASDASGRAAVVLEGGAVAAVTALACALAAVRLGAVPQLAAYCALAGVLAVVSVTDLRTGLVPRRIVYAGAAIVGVALLAASATNGQWRPMLDALLGAVGAFAVLGAVWWISPKAMGFGDVRLAGLCGGALGWLGFVPLYLGFLAGFVIGAVMGVGVLVVHGRRRFPFAPALAAGTMFGVLWGGWLGALWFHLP